MNALLSAIDRRRKWVFIAPTLLVVALMIVIPIGWTAVVSLTNARGALNLGADFVGLDNYESVLTDTQRFWPAVARTLAFTGGALGLELLLGLGIALLLWKPLRAGAIAKAVILLPLVATPVAMAMMWMLILEPNIGVANTVLRGLGVDNPPTWLADSTTALPVLIGIDVWQWTPMVALILLAGLTSLPEEPFEAAVVDGARADQILRLVTLPLLAPSLAAAALLRGVDAMKTFDIIYTTKGSAGGSLHEAETLNIYAYSLTFDYADYGRAATVLMLFLVLIVALSACVIIWRHVHSRED